MAVILLDYISGRLLYFTILPIFYWVVG